MIIYIDESGSFTIPTTNSSSISCVAGLIIPEHQSEEIFRKFAELKKGLALGVGERKGSELNEDQISQIIALLNKFNVVLEISAIDMGLHPQTMLEQFRAQQAANMVKNLTQEHHPQFVSALYQMKKEIEEMSYPLFVQAVISVTVISQILEIALVYYALQAPEELGAFKWVIDAKGHKITTYQVVEKVELLNPFSSNCVLT